MEFVEGMRAHPDPADPRYYQIIGRKPLKANVADRQALFRALGLEGLDLDDYGNRRLHLKALLIEKD